MLYITFGTFSKLIEDNNKIMIDADNNFKHIFKKEWLESDIAKEIVKKIDKCELISPYCIDSPIFGQISPHMLSGGTKALLILLNTDIYMWAGTMGDNCMPFVVEMSKTKDIHLGVDNFIFFNGYSPLWEDRELYTDEQRRELKGNLPTEMEAIITNTGKHVYTFDEYANYYMDCDADESFDWLSTDEKRRNDEFIAEMTRLGIDKEEWTKI